MIVIFEQQLEKDKIRRIRHKNIPKLFTVKKKSLYIIKESTKIFLVEQKFTSPCDIHQRIPSIKYLIPPPRLKTSENLWFSVFFREYQNQKIALK